MKHLLLLGFGFALAMPLRAAPGRLTLYPHVYEAVKGELYVPCEWGRVEVRENRARPDSRWIETAFLRFRGTSPRPGVPIFLLPGGPGSTYFTLFKSRRGVAYLDWLRSIADVVVVEQRGANESRPQLNSPYTLALPLDHPLGRAELIDAVDACARKTRQFWEDQGFDLSGYTTNALADDVDDLRQALGYPRISLIGTSFGSHWGLAIIDRHQDHLYRAVLTGIHGRDQTLDMPADMDLQLKKIAALVRADPKLGKRIPDLFGSVRGLIAQLGRQPVTAVIPDPVEPGKNVSIVLGKIDFQIAVSSPDFFRGWVRELQRAPAEIYDMEHGDWSSLARVALARRRMQADNAMMRLVRNASGISPERKARFEAQARQSIYEDYHEFPDTEDAAAWNGPDLGPRFRENIHSDFPVLLLNGDLDALTVMRNAEETLAGFPNGHLIKLRNFGHATLHSELESYSAFQASPALRQIVTEYLEGRPIHPPEWLDMPPLVFAWPKTAPRP